MRRHVLLRVAVVIRNIELRRVRMDGGNFPGKPLAITHVPTLYFDAHFKLRRLLQTLRDLEVFLLPLCLLHVLFDFGDAAFARELPFTVQRVRHFLHSLE